MLLFWSKKGLKRKTASSLCLVVETVRFELMTSRDANRTLYQLSYAPKYLLFSMTTLISIIDFLQKIKRVAEIFLPENLRHGW